MFSDEVLAAIKPIFLSGPKMDLRRKWNFVKLLCLIHQNMRATPELLRICAAQPGPFQAYFQKHLEEEQDHVAWLEEDLRFLDAKPSDVLLIPEMLTMVGEQYYLIQHVSPVSLFGYMMMLEGFPAPPGVIKALVKLYGRGAHTLAFHAENDPHHLDDLRDCVDQVDHGLRWIVMQSAVRSAELYRDAMWRLSFEK